MASIQYPLTVYYDRSCSLCRNEMHFLAARGGPERIHLVDASAADFDNDTGIRTEELMARIHGKTADGVLISGMALLRSAYAAAGLGWILRPTGWPVLAPLFDSLYIIVANHRYLLPAWVSHRLFAHGSCRNDQCKR